MRLPAGCFTVDRDNRVIMSTLPAHFPASRISAIGQTAIDTFRTSNDAQVTLRELTIHYAALKITARELRGGAIIFLQPLSLGQGSSKD
jgi:hypothetical protein